METVHPLRVLHVISGLGLGGAERMLLWSARNHDRSRFKMAVLSLMSGMELAGAIRGEDIPVYELSQSRGRLNAAGIKGVLKVVDDFDPSILQGHMYHSNILVRAVGLIRRGLKVVNTRHIDFEPMPRRIVNSLTSFAVDETIVFSQKVLDAEKRESPFGPSPRLITYGIDLSGSSVGREEARLRMGVPENGRVWIAVGRLSCQKGFDLLLEAFGKIAAQEEKPWLVIVGEGDQRQSLMEMSARWSLTDHVLFLGDRGDAGDLMTGADYFVLSSLWEGGPLVVLEAMAAGLPVVATDVGDVSSMVVDGETGFVVQPSRSDELARAMNQMMDLDSRARELGQAGLERVRKLYDYSSTQREIERCYLELGGTNPPESDSRS